MTPLTTLFMILFSAAFGAALYFGKAYYKLKHRKDDTK